MRTVLWILGGLIVLFVVFGLGIAVGYERAGFADGFDRNYFRIFFGGPPTGPIGMMVPPMSGNLHGVVGTVIDLGTSTISVENQQNNEQSVVVFPGTIIRDGNNTVMIDAMEIGDQIAVIGEPNDQGQIVAHFVRILFTPSSTQN